MGFKETVDQLLNHFSCNNQNWLFGSGISYDANIPTMKVLTEIVENKLPSGEIKELYSDISNVLAKPYNVEQVLSCIIDYIAISKRNEREEIQINAKAYTSQKLRDLYAGIVKTIGLTIRYGYRKGAGGAPDVEGSLQQPIIDIKNHVKFVQSLISSRSNLLDRSKISVFTTNYDTLLEDAFGLEQVEVNDGFVGASIGFWRPELSYSNQRGIDVVKLHGSVDWVKDSDRLLRIRYGSNYSGSHDQVLIYPQATKYIETQRDPFAFLFAKMRENIASDNDNVLIVNGYSFGDDHINSEIELSLSNNNSKTTLIVFIDQLVPFLDKLLQSPNISRRVYIASKIGIYNGTNVLIPNVGSTELNWWKFSELSDFINSGDPK